MNVSVRVKNRRMVQTAEPKPHRLLGILVLLVLATFVALFYAAASKRTLNLSYEASRALEEQRDLREQARRLKVELNHLRSPQRLEREAKALGLSEPQPGQVRRIK